MARAGEPADSDGSIEWVMLHVGETDQTYYWNRRSGATTWCAPAGVKVVWMGGKSDRGILVLQQGHWLHCACSPSAASWVTGYGVRGLASPHPFLGATPLACSKSGPGECGLLPGAFRRRRHGVVGFFFLLGERGASEFWSAVRGCYMGRD